MKLVAFTIGLSALATAQMFIPEPKDTTEILSELYPGASISYKQVRLHQMQQTTAPTEISNGPG